MFVNDTFWREEEGTGGLLVKRERRGNWIRRRIGCGGMMKVSELERKRLKMTRREENE